MLLPVAPLEPMSPLLNSQRTSFFSPPALVFWASICSLNWERPAFGCTWPTGATSRMSVRTKSRLIWGRSARESGEEGNGRGKTQGRQRERGKGGRARNGVTMAGGATLKSDEEDGEGSTAGGRAKVSVQAILPLVWWR